MATNESERAFLEHDWRNDTKWHEYLSQLYPTPSVNKVLKYKKKYYKKEVDADFDLDSKVGEVVNNESSSTESRPQRPPTAGYTRPPVPPQPTASRSSLEKVGTLHLAAGLIFSLISMLPVAMAGRAYTVSLVAYIIGCMAHVCSHMGVPKFNMAWWSTACQLEAFQILMVVMGASSLKIFAAMLSPAIGAIQLIADSPSLGQIGLVKSYLDLVKRKRVELSRLRAHLEVSTGFLLLVFCLMGRVRLWPVVLYWQTVRGRASLNYYTRESFGVADGYIRRVLTHPKAPGVLLTGYEWVVSKVAQ